MSVGSGRSSSEPASSFERSSSSVASFGRRAVCSRIWCDEVPAGLGVELLVLEQLDEAAEREDRRSQLVRGGRDELLARRVELGELALHLVERPRELAQLVVGVDRDRLGEVPGGDLLGRALQPPEPPRDPAAR